MSPKKQRSTEELHKFIAQQRKAARLAVKVLRAMPELPSSRAQVERILRDRKLRRTAEAAAGVHQSSDDTWQMVVEILT